MRSPCERIRAGSIPGRHARWIDEQQQTIDAIQRTAEHAVRQACAVMAQAGAPYVHSKISKWTVKGGDLKLELAVTPLVENMIALAEHGSRGAILVLADASTFLG
jgi:hypothetical protein